MHRGPWVTQAWRAGGIGLALALVLSGCSGDGDDEPESKRRCAAVQPSKLSDLLDEDMTLERAEEGRSLCIFTSADGELLVQMGVDGPVEAGTPELILTDPTPIADLGDEAWTSVTDVPLDARAVVRVGGAMLTIDLDAPRLSQRARLEQLVAIAEEGADGLPEMEVRDATGPRGDEACARYGEDRVAVALGGVPAVTAISPPGSCRIDVEAVGLTVTVVILAEEGVSEGSLEAIVAGVDTAEDGTVRDLPTSWVANADGDRSGGQLYLIADERLVQIAVFGSGLEPGLARETAEAIAGVGLDG